MSKTNNKLFKFSLLFITCVTICLSVLFSLSFLENDKTIFNLKAATTAETSKTTISGADNASVSLKGGAIYVSEGSEYHMVGGTYSGHQNKYGGAVYVARGGTFVLDGGVIENNTACYGGAIYVEKGGTCIIKGGSIKNNSAQVSPAIHVEPGATLKIKNVSVIKKNYKIEYEEEFATGNILTIKNLKNDNSTYVHRAEDFTISDDFTISFFDTEMNQIVKYKAHCDTFWFNYGYIFNETTQETMSNGFNELTQDTVLSFNFTENSYTLGLDKDADLLLDENIKISYASEIVVSGNQLIVSVGSNGDTITYESTFSNTVDSVGRVFNGWKFNGEILADGSYSPQTFTSGEMIYATYKTLNSVDLQVLDVNNGAVLFEFKENFIEGVSLDISLTQNPDNIYYFINLDVNYNTNFEFDLSNVETVNIKNSNNESVIILPTDGVSFNANNQEADLVYKIYIKYYIVENGFVFNSTDTEKRNLIGYVGSETDLRIPASVQTISNNVFANKTSITSVVLPSGLISVGQTAFYNCSSLKTVIIENNSSVVSLGSNAFALCNPELLIYVPTNNYYSYKASSGWSLYLNNIETYEYETDSDLSFEYLDGVSTFTVSNSNVAKVVGFKGEDKTTLNIAHNVIKVDEAQNISIHKITTIGQDAFKGKSMTTIKIFGNVSTIEQGAFSGCSNITDVYLPHVNEWINVDLVDSTSSPLCAIENEKVYFDNVLTTILNINPSESSEIKAYVFACFDTLKSVTINGNVSSIGEYAFDGCSNLETVNLSEGLETIEMAAFMECSSLQEITIPEGVTNIGELAFIVCLALREITIPASVTNIGELAFYGGTIVASKIKVNENNNVYTSQDASGNEINAIINKANKELLVGCKATEIPSDGSVEKIGNCAFALVYNEFYTNLISNAYEQIGKPLELPETPELLAIPSSIKTIGFGAFAGSNIENIIIPTSVENLICIYDGELKDIESDQNSPFVSSTSTIYVPYADIDSVPEGCLTGLELYDQDNIVYGFVFSDDGRTIIDYVGTETNITIPDFVTTIGEAAFSNLTTINSVTILDNVTTINKDAFKGCSGLKTLTLGGGLTSIGADAFYGCSSIETINALSSWVDVELANEYSNPMYAPEGEAIYLDNSSTQRTRLYMNLEEIKAYTFAGYDTLIYMKIGDMVQSIGEGAFKGCFNIETLIIGSGLTDGISQNMFIDCSNIIQLSVDCNLNEKAFENKWQLEQVEICSNVTSIGADAFYDCYNIQTIGLPDVLTWINVNLANEYSNPMYCNAYEAVYFFDGEEYQLTTEIVIAPTIEDEINDFAFIDYENLASVAFNENITSIGLGSFAFCYGLREITIPASVTNIGEGAFFETNPYVTTITVSEDNSVYTSQDASGKEVNAIIDIANKELLVGCRATEIPADGSVEKIADYAFADVYNDFYNYEEYVEIPELLVIPSSIKTIGVWAFAWSDIENIIIPTSVEIMDCSVNGYLSNEEYTYKDYIYSPFYFSTSTIYVPYADESSVPSGWETGWNYKYTQEDDDLLNIVYGFIFSEDGRTIVDYVGTAEDVVIPDFVTTIGYFAFSGCTSIKTITIPENVLVIANDAFEGCVNITDIYLPEIAKWINVVMLSEYSNPLFANNYWLDTGEFVKAQENVYFFNGEEYQLTTELVISPTETDEINDFAFIGYDSLTSVTIGENITRIGESAFANCESLEEITIPESVTVIGRDAFIGSYNIANVYLPELLIWMDIELVNDCSTPIFANDVQENVYFFNGEEYQLTTELVIAPEKNDEIYQYTFAGFDSLTSVTINEKIIKIACFAFAACYNLETVNLSEGLENIEEYAFAYCESLGEITIPSTVTSIGKNAFDGCLNLVTVTVLATAVPEAKSYDGNDLSTDEKWEAFDNCNEELKIFVLAELLEDYKTAIGWSEYADRIFPLGVEDEIFTYTYDDENFTATVTGLKEGVTLTEMVIPEETYYEGNYYSVTAIGDSAFSGNTDVTDVTIPDSITSIGTGAFNGCENIEKLDVGSGLTGGVDHNMFGGCANLKVLSVDSYIKDEAFPNHKLEELTIGRNVKNIGFWALKSENNIVGRGSGNLYIESLESWCHILFNSSNGLFLSFKDVYFDGATTPTTSITIPESITKINMCAFENYATLTSVNLHNKIEIIEPRAFCSCGLQSLTIPSSVKEIRNGAFSHCHSLKSVNLSEGLEIIRDSAFGSCSWLESIEIPASVTQIEGVPVDGYQNRLTSLKVSINNSVYTSRDLNGNEVNAIIDIANKTLINGCRVTEIPNDGSVEKIGDFAFDTTFYTKQLKYEDEVEIPSLLVIPSSIKSIGYNAFNGINCDYVIISSGVETLITYKSNYNAAQSPFGGLSTATIYVPYADEASVPSGWGTKWNYNSLNTQLNIVYGFVFDDTGTKIIDYVGTATNIVIPDFVTEIGESVFAYTDITEISLPSGLEVINKEAFMGCETLTTINIPSSVNQIGDGAFKDSGLTGADVYASEIGDNMFYGCESLAYIWIRSNVTRIGEQAFYYCNSLKYVKFLTRTDAWIDVGQYAFAYCEELDTIEFEENSIIHLGGYMFSNCKALRVINLPEGLESINSYAFDGCSKLIQITLPDSIVTIYNRAFNDCTSLEHIFIPSESIQDVEDGAFNGCNSSLQIYIEYYTCSQLDQKFGGSGWRQTATNNTITPITVNSREEYDTAVGL